MLIVKPLLLMLENYREKSVFTEDTYWIVRGLLLSGMNETARGVQLVFSEWIRLSLICHPNNLTSEQRNPFFQSFYGCVPT